MSSPLSPFLNNVASAGQFQAGVSELGRSGIAFGDVEALAVSCAVSLLSELGELHAGRRCPGLRQAWLVPSKVGGGSPAGPGAVGAGVAKPTGSKVPVLLTEQLVVFSKSAS